MGSGHRFAAAANRSWASIACCQAMGRRILLLMPALLLFSAGTASAVQTVWLDFITDLDPGEHVYTAAEQASVRDTIAADYQAFDFSFTLTAPGSGNYSTLTFNSDLVSGGLADAIDFRNLDPSDNAIINVNAFLGGFGEPAATSANFVSMASGVGAHELGHLVGLRHLDSMGPIGSGISPVPGTGAFLPIYPGPTGADEAAGHTMASPASVGSSLFDLAGNTFFSERSAIKLTFNESGSVVGETGGNHDTLPTAQAITLAALSVPNTIVTGDNAGESFAVAAVGVTGSLGGVGEEDIYSFSGSEDDLMNFEVISNVLDRIGNPIDSMISILDSGGSPVAYYSGTASNDDEFETQDSIIIDLLLPATGTYYIKVSAFNAFDTGDYELFAHRFALVPEPGTFSLLGLGLLAALGMQRTPWRSRSRVR